MPDLEVIERYSKKASELSESYQSVNRESFLSPFLSFFKKPSARLIDIGAGSGRDTSYFTKKGYEVTAVEPALGFLKLAQKQHKHLSGIKWIEDTLPHLSKIKETFDITFMNAVWMHIAPDERAEAWLRLEEITKPGGIIFLSHRIPLDLSRNMHPTFIEELEQPTDNIIRIHREIRNDSLGRDDVQWDVNILRRT